MSYPSFNISITIMKLFHSLKHIIIRFFSPFMKEEEKKDPVKVYTTLINEKLKKQDELEKAFGNIVTLQNKALSELSNIDKEIEKIRCQVEAIVKKDESTTKKDEEDKAILLLMRMDELILIETDKVKELKTLKEQLEDGQKALEQFQTIIENLVLGVEEISEIRSEEVEKIKKEIGKRRREIENKKVSQTIDDKMNRHLDERIKGVFASDNLAQLLHKIHKSISAEQKAKARLRELKAMIEWKRKNEKPTNKKI